MCSDVLLLTVLEKKVTHCLLQGQRGPCIIKEVI